MIFTMIASLVYTTVCYYCCHTKAVGLNCFAHPRFFQENGVFKICERRDCDSPSDASQPALLSPRSRAGIVAFIYCCLVRLNDGGLGAPGENVSLPACTRGSICRGAALIRWLSARSDTAAELCFSPCSTEEPPQILNRSIFRATQKTELMESHFRVDRKRHHPRSHQFSCSCCDCTFT